MLSNCSGRIVFGSSDASFDGVFQVGGGDRFLGETGHVAGVGDDGETEDEEDKTGCGFRRCWTIRKTAGEAVPCRECLRD